MSGGGKNCARVRPGLPLPDIFIFLFRFLPGLPVSVEHGDSGVAVIFYQTVVMVATGDPSCCGMAELTG